MRGGTPLNCVGNAAAGDETRFAAAKPPQGERIAIIGAGPAGLTYASLVAGANRVTVFEREATPGRAFRRAGQAPLFQEGMAEQASFNRYNAGLEGTCIFKGDIVLYSVYVVKPPQL